MVGTTTLFVVAAWVLVQGASEILPAFNIPDYAIRYVWMGVVLCFPLAMLVGWRYDISSPGVRRTGTTPAKDSSLRRSDYLLLGSVGALAIGLGAILMAPDAGGEPKTLGAIQIAVTLCTEDLMGATWIRRG